MKQNKKRLSFNLIRLHFMENCSFGKANGTKFERSDGLSAKLNTE